MSDAVPSKHWDRLQENLNRRSERLGLPKVQVVPVTDVEQDLLLENDQEQLEDKLYELEDSGKSDALTKKKISKLGEVV